MLGIVISTQKLTNNTVTHYLSLGSRTQQDREQKHNIVIQQNLNYLKTSSFRQCVAVATKVMKFNIKATLFSVTLCICQSVIIYII